MTGVVTRDVVLELVDVEVSDGYGVLVAQTKRRVEYSPAEALAFAEALRRAAWGAQRALHEDQAARPVALRGSAHGFDVAPVCRECGEGKHGACNGEAIVEDAAGEVWQTGCGCSVAGHNVIEAAS